MNLPLMTYEPPCVKIKPGTTVKIPGSSMHHMQAAEDPGGVVNPIRAERPHQFDKTYTFTEPGFYGYHCTVHCRDNTGMAAAIWVAE